MRPRDANCATRFKATMMGKSTKQNSQPPPSRGVVRQRCRVYASGRFNAVLQMAGVMRACPRRHQLQLQLLAQALIARFKNGRAARFTVDGGAEQQTYFIHQPALRKAPLMVAPPSSNSVLMPSF